MKRTEEIRNQWHPACYAALNLEFVENKQDLEFQQELSINVLPLRVDTLIIKKRHDCHIKNEIGRLFRTHNLVEFKSPDTSLSFNTFLKGVACALLYKVSEKKNKKIFLEEITLSFIRERKPYKLFEKLREDHFVIEQRFKGIYYILRSECIPVQVVVSSELDRKNHIWLNSLTKRLNHKRAEELVEITNKLMELDEKQHADCVWELVTRANRELIENIREEGIMCKALAEIFKPEIDAAVEVASKAASKEGFDNGFHNGFSNGFNNGFHNGFNNGTADKGIQVFKNLLQRGFSREDAQSIAEISDELVERALTEC